MVDPSRGGGRLVARRDVLAQGSATAIAAPAGIAHAQPRTADWPSRPVRYIESFAPGSASDIASRAWCAAMTEVTGQQFVVDNRTGAGGTIGTTALARSAPDGYTIGLSGIGSLVIAPAITPSPPYDPARDFTFIAGFFHQPLLLVVNNDVPARSVPELIEMLRRNPGHHHYGAAGTGSTVHLAGELFKERAGVDMGHVPYRGGPPLLLDLIAGRVPIACVLFSAGIVSVREGKMRGLAVTSRERSPAAPDIPAMAEFLPGFDLTVWAVIAGPAGIPPALAERMGRLCDQALARPSLVQRFQQDGITPWLASPPRSPPTVRNKRHSWRRSSAPRARGWNRRLGGSAG
jgi:tripartite-type tricarboxylate transporter receptor subunit TctC